MAGHARPFSWYFPGLLIDPLGAIGLTVGADAIGTTVLIGLNGATAGAAPINLLTNQARPSTMPVPVLLSSELARSLSWTARSQLVKGP